MSCYSRRKPSIHPGVGPFEPTLTQQHFKNECDINTVLSRYSETGLMPNHPGSFYGDFSDELSYQNALDCLQNTRDEFLTLPAIVRANFDNDPGKLIRFVNDPNNLDKFASVGLANPIRDSSPLDVTVTTDTPSTKSEEK